MAANSNDSGAAAPLAWDSEGLVAKARLYFERAFLAAEDETLFAFWSHLALEHLLRAALASVHPALLANGPGKSLHYGLGLEPSQDPVEADSIRTRAVIEQVARFVDGFSKRDKAVCEQAVQRRNAELHSAVAAMEDLEVGWRARLFSTCRTLARHLELELKDLLGAEQAALVEQLIVKDAAEVREAVNRGREAARKRVARLSGSERKKREEAIHDELHPRGDPLAVWRTGRQNPRILKELPCPVCETTIALRGEVTSRNPPRIDADGDLVQTEVALPSTLKCGVCGFKADGLPELAVLGLSDPVYLNDYPDPVETFDVDLSAYQDEILSSAFGPEYQDE